MVVEVGLAQGHRGGRLIAHAVHAAAMREGRRGESEKRVKR